MLLVFLTPRQALSSHPRQQMVWFYCIQDRNSMPIRYTINHSTTLNTHDETQWPTAARQWHFMLRDVSRRQSCHLSTPSHPRVPPPFSFYSSKEKLQNQFDNNKRDDRLTYPLHQRPLLIQRPNIWSVLTTILLRVRQYQARVCQKSFVKDSVFPWTSHLNHRQCKDNRYGLIPL